MILLEILYIILHLEDKITKGLCQLDYLSLKLNIPTLHYGFMLKFHDAVRKLWDNTPYGDLIFIRIHMS